MPDIPPEIAKRLVKAARDGACAWWDGYTIDATCLIEGTPERYSFENGWKRARDQAILEGLARPGADNTLTTNIT